MSDPQNCKIQKVPGYFLKTILGLFFYLIDDFSMKIRGVLTLSVMETRKYPCTFKRHFDFRNFKDLKSNVVLKQKYTLYSIVCLDNVKYRSTLGSNGGGWGYFKQVCGKK